MSRKKELIRSIIVKKEHFNRYNKFYVEFYSFVLDNHNMGLITEFQMFAMLSTLTDQIVYKFLRIWHDLEHDKPAFLQRRYPDYEEFEEWNKSMMISVNDPNQTSLSDEDENRSDGKIPSHIEFTLKDVPKQ